ncbi:nucleoside deaminase [Marivirga sp. S37H4]|uniref:tRNA-specific adenosine deaminase n=1 Tax=Marivirga aurantiaca TaxID=2802615 RepID=A0A934WXN0_9BACT|nr:nucleoside deaminase [Marivirga aurantiaca]MBK6265043.1 nucleoside deaminase [Marivirga aurantiaca]
MELTVYSDEHFMKEALKQAQIAFEEGEIPVGAVVVCQKKIIAKAYNQTERLNDVTAHAEMLAITSAANFLGGKYLKGCTLYVTLEPCGMCAGALFWSQVDKIVFALPDEKRGFTTINPQMIHPKTQLMSGLMAAESKKMIDEFFATVRKKN